MVAEENDKELVRRAKSGDHQAFAQLVEENQKLKYDLDQELEWRHRTDS